MNHNTVDVKTRRRPIRCAAYFLGHVRSGPFAGPWGYVFGLRLNDLSRDVECWHGFRKIPLSDVIPEAGTDFSFDSTISVKDVLEIMGSVHTLCDVNLGTVGLCTFERE